MNHKESDNYKVEFSQDEFYWFSRCRHWKVCEFLRLAFNNKTLEFPKPGTPEYRYLKLIDFEIEKGENLKLIGITPSSPDYKFLRLGATPLVEMPIGERRFYTDLLSARQSFSFTFLHHYTKVWQRSPPEFKIPDIFPLLMNSKYAVTVSPGFLEMQEEIFGSELKDFSKTTPVWTGLDIIQIVFGPRYKDENNLKLDPVASFIRLAEGYIQTRNLSPLKSSPSREFLKATFKPASLVGFIYREDVFQWLKRRGVDILEWVSEMFDRIEIKAEEAEDVEDSVSPDVHPEIKKTVAAPAPTAPTLKKSGKGKRSSPLKPRVIETALALRDSGHTSAKKIARLSYITRTLAPDARHDGLANLSDNDYEKRFKHKPVTVEKWIRDGFIKNPLS